MIKYRAFPMISLTMRDLDCRNYRCLAAFNAIIPDCDVDKYWYRICDPVVGTGTACPAGRPCSVHANLFKPHLVFRVYRRT
jgi:hypothetical protein